MFLKKQHLKGYEDIFNTSGVRGKQTLAEKHEKCLFSIFGRSPLAYNARKITKVNRFN